ncbi:DUF805 domain-containing protein [Jannaschia donghaensis]|uniref:Inner membrane protein YhaI n=1 Tax=Jannaschia donghaensis TaxID=420998 RepID=A0A0M6YM61_9RHOB|nr:DUF805 domain-containing protein [Jannaschia donghaensis]CTQ51030.1 Inner membrane protein YhaI [Jannaschia donghaensis]
MGPIQATASCVRKAVTFAGRASRSEFWWFMLVFFVASFIASGVILLPLVPVIGDLAALEQSGLPTADASRRLEGVLAGTARNYFIYLTFSAVFWVVSISATVRRLHDTDRSGWWWWVQAVPFVGWIILLILTVAPGDDGHNRYGAPPTSGKGRKDVTLRADLPRKTIPKGLPGEPYNPVNELTTTEELRALRASRMAN